MVEKGSDVWNTKHKQNSSLWSLNINSQLPAAIELSASVPEALDINSPKKNQTQHPPQNPYQKEAHREIFVKKVAFFAVQEKLKWKAAAVVVEEYQNQPSKQ
jgi:hypothetical protein